MGERLLGQLGNGGDEEADNTSVDLIVVIKDIPKPSRELPTNAQVVITPINEWGGVVGPAVHTTLEDLDW